MQFQLTEYRGSRFVTVAATLSEKCLTLQYNLSSIAQIRWPVPEEADIDSLPRRDGLWQHTCLELFVASAGNRSYSELNLSPTGSWNCYSFTDYRQEMQESSAMTLQTLSWNPEAKQITAEVDLALSTDSYLLGPAVVVEDYAGGLSYFALSHDDQPDFHNRKHYVHTSRNHL